jgi:hypothetical protein
MDSALPLKHIVLTGFAAVFASAIGYQLLRTPPAHAPEAERIIEHARHRPETAVVPTSSDDIAVLDERPPFHPLRRASVPQPFADIQEWEDPQPLPDVRLIGVVLAGAHKAAMVRTPDRADTVPVVERDEVGGWTIDEIFADRVVISSGSEKREILLHAQRNE